MPVIAERIDISDRPNRENGQFDIARINKGDMITVHNAIIVTATSIEINTRSWGGIYVEMTINGSGNWDIKMTGCSISEGTFIDQYVGATQLIRSGVTVSAGFTWPIGANYTKIVATKNSGTAIVTIRVIPIAIPMITEMAASLYGKSVAAGDTPVLVDASGNVQTSLATVLSSSTDSIDVAKMSKGGVTTAHSAITATATSSEIDCRGHNAISVEMAASALSAGNWVASILGCAVSGGTFGACYAPQDAGTFVAQATPAISANGNTTYYFKGIPNYVKILATRTTDGTLTAKVTPMNL